MSVMLPYTEMNLDPSESALMRLSTREMADPVVNSVGTLQREVTRCFCPGIRFGLLYVHGKPRYSFLPAGLVRKFVSWHSSPYRSSGSISVIPHHGPHCPSPPRTQPQGDPKSYTEQSSSELHVCDMLAQHEQFTPSVHGDMSGVLQSLSLVHRFPKVKLLGATYVGKPPHVLSSRPIEVSSCAM